MGVEIERRFLVKRDVWERSGSHAGTPYVQAYLSTEPGKTIRVRIAGDDGFITIKGAASGSSKSEYEYRIPLEDAWELMEQFCGRKVEKKRTKIEHEGKRWEVDVFEGENAGLLIAEIELESESEHVPLPAWIDREITGDHRYSNSALSLHPYRDWVDR